MRERRRGYEKSRLPFNGDPPHFVREYRSEDVDLDHLAEAIRKLLGDGIGPLPGLSDGPDSELLSARHRATHVVGGNGEP